MPPSAKRAGLRSRREPDPQLQSDADTPDSIATPTRKRRRLNGAEPAPATANTDAPRARITESVASNDSNATLPNATEAEAPADPVERQNHIIAHLRTPAGYIPNAAIDYANDLQARKIRGENVAAFAKIAARDWCFFVQKTRLIIGRADSTIRPNPPERSQHGASSLPQSEDPAAEWGVDIDLGPERMVSRVHAQIEYDGNDQTWYIHVNSRNGLKLDDASFYRGQKAPLHSGICIGIMGTQMLFLLAGKDDAFHPMLWRQVNQDREANESDHEGNPPSRSLPHAHPSGPTPKREPYDPFPPTSSRNKQSSQGHGNQLMSTPGRPLDGTPMTFRSAEKDPHGKGSPGAYPRGMMLDSTEDIDYSLDTAKDIKPPHSYAQLIGQAIMSSPEEMLTLANIYEHIRQRYAFFRHAGTGWQNSIRHNLSLNKCFEKVARRTDEPGKGMKWKIADSERAEFVKKQLLTRKSGGSHRVETSGPSSPAIASSQLRDQKYRVENPFQATERLQNALDQTDVFVKQSTGARVKSPPRSATPPLSSVLMPNESYTPDRGPRNQTQHGAFKRSPTQHEQKSFVTPAKRLVYNEPEASRIPAFAPNAEDARRGIESSPGIDPVKPNVSGLRGEAADSPPTLYSDAAGNNNNGTLDTTRMNSALQTPLVPRQAPHLAPPSTAQVPSQYMNFSSPAPFWKYINLPSTPAKVPLELSPIKSKREDGDKDGGEEPIHPSSPPIITDEDNSGEPEDKDEEEDGEEVEEDLEEDAGPESPSRTVSRPVSRRDVGGTQRSRSNSNMNGFDARTSNGGMVRGVSLGSFEEDPDEASFDLTKGFQKIGSYHRNMAQAQGVLGRSSQPPDSRTSVPTGL